MDGQGWLGIDGQGWKGEGERGRRSGVERLGRGRERKRSERARQVWCGGEGARTSLE